MNNPLEKIDYLLAHFFTTQKSQSHFHKGVVTSYQFILASGNSMGQIASDIESKLGDFLKTQFTNVQISVSIDGAFDDPDNSKLMVTIACTFDAEGKRYSISHAIELLGTQVQRIVRLNETGSTS